MEMGVRGYWQSHCHWQPPFLTLNTTSHLLLFTSHSSLCLFYPLSSTKSGYKKFTHISMRPQTSELAWYVLQRCRKIKHQFKPAFYRKWTLERDYLHSQDGNRQFHNNKSAIFKKTGAKWILFFKKMFKPRETLNKITLLSTELSCILQIFNI